MKQINKELLIQVSKALDWVKEPLVYLGGAILPFYATDRLVEESRGTQDVDCVVQVLSYGDFSKFEEEMRKHGFQHSVSQDDHQFRWLYDGVIVDIIPLYHATNSSVNRWYKKGLKKPMTIELEERHSIKVFQPEIYFLTKVEAFYDRGKDDILLSKDLEDIIYLLNGREELLEEFSNLNKEEQNYLSLFITFLTVHPYYNDIIGGMISDADRIELVEERIQKLLS